MLEPDLVAQLAQLAQCGVGEDQVSPAAKLLDLHRELAEAVPGLAAARCHQVFQARARAARMHYPVRVRDVGGRPDPARSQLEPRGQRLRPVRRAQLAAGQMLLPGHRPHPDARRRQLDRGDHGTTHSGVIHPGRIAAEEDQPGEIGDRAVERRPQLAAARAVEQFRVAQADSRLQQQPVPEREAHELRDRRRSGQPGQVGAQHRDRQLAAGTHSQLVLACAGRSG